MTKELKNELEKIGSEAELGLCMRYGRDCAVGEAIVLRSRRRPSRQYSRVPF